MVAGDREAGLENLEVRMVRMAGPEEDLDQHTEDDTEDGRGRIQVGNKV